MRFAAGYWCLISVEFEPRPSLVQCSITAVCFEQRRLSEPSKLNWHWRSAVHRTGPESVRQSLDKAVEFRFANYFQDSMVLQRGGPGADIWGFGEPLQKVLVQFKGAQFNTTVDGE